MKGKNRMNPDPATTWESRAKAIPRPIRAAFFACVILGFVIHLFAFTNMIPNSDGLARMYDTQQMTVSGRWFLHYASMLHGFVQAPALIGGLSVLFLALSAAMTADVLDIRHTFAAIAVGASFVIIPALAYTFLYMFTASAYAFAVMLAVGAVWLLRKKKWGFVPAALLLACSMGTYQAYFAVAASLALMGVILDLLDAEKPLKTTVREGFRALGMLAAAAVAYGVILVIFLKVKHLELLDYRGIGTAGAGFSAAAILRNLPAALKQVIAYFFVPDASFSSVGLTAGNIALILSAAVAAAATAVRQKIWQEPARLALLIVGAVLLPVAFNMTRLLSELSPNMYYSFAMVYVFAAALLDRTELPKIGGFLRKTACCAFALAVLSNAQVCNLVYTSSATAHRATEAFATNLVARVEQTPGYRADMEVVIIGTFPRSRYHTTSPMFDAVEHYSCLSDTVIQLNKHVYYYLNDWLNVPWEQPGEDVMTAVSDSEAFQAMPLYPDDGSVKIEDGRVIVKLAPSYIPKQPYEIAYENRH